jgi:AcrR family transcriptional regulator
MNEAEPEQAVRKVGRPRSDQSHQAILEAVLAIFAEVGLQGLSIEAVAERAGVGKTTIYRRWSMKEDMVKEALDLIRSGITLPDTGTFRGDLLFLTQESRRIFTGNVLLEKLLLRLLAECKTQPEIYSVFYRNVMVPRLQEFSQIVVRAQERGELRQDLDIPFVLYLIFVSLVYSNIFLGLIDPDPQRIYDPQAAVDALLRGIGTPGS